MKETEDSPEAWVTNGTLPQQSNLEQRMNIVATQLIWSQNGTSWSGNEATYLLSGSGLVTDQHLFMSGQRESHTPSIHVQGQGCPQHILWK